MPRVNVTVLPCRMNRAALRAAGPSQAPISGVSIPMMRTGKVPPSLPVTSIVSPSTTLLTRYVTGCVVVGASVTGTLAGASVTGAAIANGTSVTGAAVDGAEVPIVSVVGG